MDRLKLFLVSQEKVTSKRSENWNTETTSLLNKCRKRNHTVLAGVMLRTGGSCGSGRCQHRMVLQMDITRYQKVNDLSTEKVNRWRIS